MVFFRRTRQFFLKSLGFEVGRKKSATDRLEGEDTISSRKPSAAGLNRDSKSQGNGIFHLDIGRVEYSKEEEI